MKKQTWNTVQFVHPEFDVHVAMTSRAKCPVCGQKPCKKDNVCLHAKKYGIWTKATY